MNSGQNRIAIHSDAESRPPLTAVSIKEGRSDSPGSHHDEEEVDRDSRENETKDSQSPAGSVGQGKNNEKQPHHSHYDRHNPPHLYHNETRSCI